MALLAVIGGQHLCCFAVARASPGLAARWRRAIDRRGAPWFASYCRRHGALLIKIGQFVASRPDLLPLPYVDACADLRDRAAASDPAAVRAVLDEAYEGRIGDHLARIEEAPIAAASFGQVHRAWLADGTLVAVKVQHPGLGPLVACDLWLLRLALRLFKLVLPQWPLELLADEAARTSREEQDYLHEGLAADRLRQALAGAGIKVPRILWEHTRERVLVMEFAPGPTLAQCDLAALPAERRRAVAVRIIDGYLTMLLDVGFFHGDPHAGNLILDGDDVWLIDFGMTAEIEPRERALYRRFLARLREEDTDGMVDALCELGQLVPGTDRSALRDLAREVYRDLGRLSPQSFKGSQRQAVLGGKVTAFVRRMRGLVLPRHTVLLTRGMGLVEGLCGELVPEESLLQLARPRLRRSLTWRAAVDERIDDLRRFWSELRALPARVEDALAGRRDGVDLSPVLAGLLILAAVQLPAGAPRMVAAAAAAAALLLALLRRR